MKRFITVLSSLLVLPAFAEVAPVYYEDVVEYTDDMIDAVDAVENESAPQQKTVINRSTSRAISSGNASAQRAGGATRAVATSPRSTQTSANRGTISRATATRKATVASRPTATRSRAATVTSRATRGNTAAKPVTARLSIGSNAMPKVVQSSEDASLNQTTITDTGTVYNARLGTTRRGNTRIATVSTSPAITTEDLAVTQTNLTAIAELTEYCKEQYSACMDNYCNVLDDNQGRCSCSKNVKNYEKTEQALETATEQFQDVVQKIRYIGLTGPQIESLFSETEAELSMRNNSDSSQLKTSLDAIKRKIVDASSPTASSYESTSNISLDVSGLLDADFTAGFDLASFLNTQQTNTSSVSNQRGDQLYKTAASRCKAAVLNSCADQGIEINVVTNSYDLEIDKQCILYERSLNEANREMKNNVRNATNILQQARLMLAQNRNSYDVRGCVAAIDACMQDEYVCGTDYELCLDPTGMYIANGEIVKGGTPGVSGGNVANTTERTDLATAWHSKGMYELYSSWNYASNGKSVGVSAGENTYNPWSGGTGENLGGYIEAVMEAWTDKKSGYTSNASTNDIALNLLRKVGYIDSSDVIHGMCASVMKQCQDYTYEGKNAKARSYKPDNEVVRQYLATALTKIKLKQDEIIADYAEDCKSDVTSCLSTNGYDDQNLNTTTSRTAIQACRADIMTCMSVGGYKPSDTTSLTLRQMSDWVSTILVNCQAGYYLIDDGIGLPVQTIPGTESAQSQASRCAVCPTVDLVASDGTPIPNTEGTGNKTVRLTSVGGSTTKCTCPSGYSDTKLATSEQVSDTNNEGDKWVIGMPTACMDSSVEGTGATTPPAEEPSQGN